MSMTSSAGLDIHIFIEVFFQIESGFGCIGNAQTVFSTVPILYRRAFPNGIIQQNGSIQPVIPVELRTNGIFLILPTKIAAIFHFIRVYQIQRRIDAAYPTITDRKVVFFKVGIVSITTHQNKLGILKVILE